MRSELPAHTFARAIDRRVSQTVADLGCCSRAARDRGATQGVAPGPARAAAGAPAQGLDYDALAEVVADAIKAAVAPLHARIEALERRPELKFVGPFRGGTHYLAGTIVQKQGLWLCEADTHATPGEEDSGWRLILKAAPR